MADLNGIVARTGLANTLQPQAEQALAKARAAQASGSDERVEKSARQFEAILLSQWLEQAEKTFGTVPGGGEGDDEDADPGRDEFQGIAMQSLATSITAAGGIGIAKLISAQLHRAESHQPAENKQVTDGGMAFRQVSK